MTATMTARRPTQRGSASVWAVLVTAGTFTLLLGLVVDGGRLIDARVASSRTAAQAARAGADALSAASVRNGGDDVSGAQAVDRVESYLHATGATGAVHVSGDTVAVTVTGRSTPQILGVIGITSFPIEETQTARGISEEP